jgi:hypothetical protein
MAALIEKTESDERKAALREDAESLQYDIISRSEEHFGADSFEVGRAITTLLQLRMRCYPGHLSLLGPTASNTALA